MMHRPYPRRRYGRDGLDLRDVIREGQTMAGEMSDDLEGLLRRWDRLPPAEVQEQVERVATALKGLVLVDASDLEDLVGDWRRELA